MPPILKDLRPMDFAEAVAHACGVPSDDFYLGATRLFLRGGTGTFLEELRHMDVEKVICPSDSLSLLSAVLSYVLSYVLSSVLSPRITSPIFLLTSPGSGDAAAARAYHAHRAPPLRLVAAGEVIMPLPGSPSSPLLSPLLSSLLSSLLPSPRSKAAADVAPPR